MITKRIIPSGILNLFFLFIIIAAMVPNAISQRRELQMTEIHGHTMYTVLKPGDIPAIFEPEFISIENARDLYYPSEPLIAVIDGSTAKAYSTLHLDHHEVVNDYINGKAITVTW